MTESVKLSRELYDLVEDKRRSEEKLKQVNIAIQHKTAALIAQMAQDETQMISDAETGKRFALIERVNVKASDYGKLHDEEMREVFEENGYRIFKYTVHAQTLAATVRNDIMQEDNLPDWVTPYVETSTYADIKII